MYLKFANNIKTFRELIDDLQFKILIMDGDKEIGFVDGDIDHIQMHIALITLNDDYTRKGIGTSVITEIKKVAKDNGLEYIHGECRGELKSFYQNLGAVFECRDEFDETFILNKFYIDL